MRILSCLLLVFTVLYYSCVLENTDAIDVLTNDISEISSLTPNLFSDNDGRQFISWLETPSDSLAELYYSEWKENKWTKKSLIASGKNWFVNWADFPSVIVNPFNSSHWATHWLQYTGEGTYDYEVRIAQSMDGGKKWSQSIVPHLDGINAEHGFVSIIGNSANDIRAVWLDGRFTKTEEEENEHGHGHGHGGAMTLRTALIDHQGSISDSQELDNRVCDCCQTAMTMTDATTTVVYRDRSADEVRDISFVQFQEDNWSNPNPIHEDNWNIAGCPVNGPVIKSEGKLTAAAWYTMPNEQASVRMKISTDAAKNFGQLIQVADKNAIGRLDLAMSDSKIYLAWVEAEGDEAKILIRQYDSSGNVLQNLEETKISAQRSSGFPSIAILNSNEILLAWTRVLEADTRVTTKTITIPSLQ